MSPLCRAKRKCQRNGGQRLFLYSSDHHSSDPFSCPIHLSAIHSGLIPSAPLENDVKYRVDGLERITVVSLEDRLPGQAWSHWVKVGQTDEGKGQMLNAKD